MKKDFRDELAEQFIELIDQQQFNWKQGWNAIGLPKNGITNRPYSGINMLYLMMQIKKRGVSGNRFYTFNQIADREKKFHKGEKWKLKKGSKAYTIEYPAVYVYEVGEDKSILKGVSITEAEKFISENGSDKYYTKVYNNTHYVYSEDDIEGIKPDNTIKKVNHLNKEFVNRLAASMQVSISEDPLGMAYYVPSKDAILLPKDESWEDEYSYQSTVLHELTHATGHQKRLNRESLYKYFTNEDRAKEELVAELGSAFMMAYFNIEIPSYHFNNHLAYLQSWKQEIKQDKNYLIDAIRNSYKATDYMAEQYNKGIEKKIVKDVKQEYLSTTDIKDRILIQDYAMHLGFTLEKERGGIRYTMKEHDSLKIFTQTNTFVWFSQTQANGKKVGGSIIDFIKHLDHRAEGDEGKAIALAKEYIFQHNLQKNNIYTEGAIVQDNFDLAEDKIIYKQLCRAGDYGSRNPELPERADNNKRVYSYLTKTRGIDKEVVNAWIARNKVYQDHRGNVVFVETDFDNKVKNIHVKGTLTDKPFRLDVDDSVKLAGITFTNKDSKSLFITESVIDAMSIQSQGNDREGWIKDNDYLSLQGVNIDTIKHYLLTHDTSNLQNVYICTDNDSAGDLAAQHIESFFEQAIHDPKYELNNLYIGRVKPQTKDFNQDLVEGLGHTNDLNRTQNIVPSQTQSFGPQR